MSWTDESSQLKDLLIEYDSSYLFLKQRYPQELVHPIQKFTTKVLEFLFRKSWLKETLWIENLKKFSSNLGCIWWPTSTTVANIRRWQEEVVAIMSVMDGFDFQIFGIQIFQLAQFLKIEKDFEKINIESNHQISFWSCFLYFWKKKKKTKEKKCGVPT